MKNNKKELSFQERQRVEKLDKEDALVAKWKPFLPDIKITRRNSRKRRMMVMTAQVLDNQANYMKNMMTMSASQKTLPEMIAQQITSLTPRSPRVKDEQ
jgi:hypothetical protein